MTRDNGLFALIGILIGFIFGYMMHEVMAARQPMRLPFAANPMANAGALPPAQPTAASANAQMEQIQQLSQYVADNPDDLDAALTLANFAFDAQIWARAAELYERYLSKNAEDVDVLTDLGVCQRELGQPEEALATFDRAIGVDGQHWQSQFNRVVVLTFDLGRYAQAQEGLAALDSLEPGNEAVARLRAELDRKIAEAG